MEKEFEALLEKFYRGETDRDEELTLAGYCNRESLPEQFESDRNLFQSLAAAAPEIPAGLEQRMGVLVDSLENAEKSEENMKIPGKRVLIRRDFILRMAGLVASLLIIATTGYWAYFRQNGSESLLTETFENPEQAQKAVLEALQLFADNFSKGTRSMEQVDKQMDATFSILRETLGQDLVRVKDSDKQ